MTTCRWDADAGDYADRFWSKVEKTEEGCWLWTAAKFSTGYGVFQLRRKAMKAHRVAYGLLVGPVVDGLVLDHACHNEDTSCRGGTSCPHRACVNPAHLRAVTQRQNVLASRNTEPYRQSHKTHCSQGHEFTEETTRRDEKGHRYCVICKRERGRLTDLKRRAKPKEAA